jgi:hypothetical protein
VKVAVCACAVLVAAVLVTFGPLGATIASAACSALLLTALKLAERRDAEPLEPCTSRLEVVEGSSGVTRSFSSSGQRAS